MKNHKGFTLIEFLVVIAILGIVSTITIVAFKNAKDKNACADGDKNACKRLEDVNIKEIERINQIEKCDSQKINCRNQCTYETSGSLTECLLKCDIRREACILKKTK